MRATPRIAALFAVAATVVAAAAAPGCFFPNYTFDKNAGGAGGTGPGTGPSMTNTGGNGNQGGAGTGASGGGGGQQGCSCVSAVPTGWTGYFALYDGVPGSDPGCSTDFPTDSYAGNADLVLPMASCVCEACGAPSGEVCVLPTEIDIIDQPCSNMAAQHCIGALTNPAGWTGDCIDPFIVDMGMNYCGYQGGSTCGPGSDCATGTQGCAQAATSAAPTVDRTNASCQPGNIKMPLPDTSWARLGHACKGSPAAGSCVGSSQCLPHPGSGDVGGVCIMQAGEQQCPAQFADKHVFYEKPADTRACMGACKCKAPTGSTCSATLSIFSGQNCPGGSCTGTMLTSFQAGDCGDISGNPSIGGNRMATNITDPAGGHCQADSTGLTQTGDAVPDATTATTFCCAP